VSFVVEERRGTITVTQSVLAAMVTRAAESAGGTHVRKGRRRLEIEVSDGAARVRLELRARYGLVLPELARDVQGRVADTLSTMCGVRVESVDVSVEEVE
jgi:uncharacterized alkaline shock family protein YloU